MCNYDKEVSRGVDGSGFSDACLPDIAKGKVGSGVGGRCAAKA